MNKPVAWAYLKDGEFWDAVHPDEHEREEGSYDTPLYTHPVKEYFEDEPQTEELYEILQSNTNPVKELTDEEIMDYVEAFSIDMGNVYEFQSDNILQMIRAILDKAQEK